jgi:hypothetical protein
VTAQAALINFLSAVSPAPGAPSYASGLSGSIDAVWDNTAESFVSFDMVVSGFPTVWEFTSDHHFFIESPFTESGSYAMPIVELASVATRCCAQGPSGDVSATSAAGSVLVGELLHIIFG